VDLWVLLGELDVTYLEFADLQTFRINRFDDAVAIEDKQLVTADQASLVS
jgi:hypothetical protein